MSVSAYLTSARKIPSGFTLIEILVVLALLGLIAAMMPLALNDFYANKKYQSSVLSVVTAARQCAIKSQQYQRSMLFGSASCPLSAALIQTIDVDRMPSFYPDGTASHRAELHIRSLDSIQQPTAIIIIDKVTANVTLAANE